MALLTPSQSERKHKAFLLSDVASILVLLLEGNACDETRLIPGEVGRECENSLQEHSTRAAAFCPSLLTLLFNLQEMGVGSALLSLVEPECSSKLLLRI